MIPTQRTAHTLGRIRVQAAIQAPVLVHAHKTPGRTGQARALASTRSIPSETTRLVRPVGISQYRRFATSTAASGKQVPYPILARADILFASRSIHEEASF